MQRDLTDFGSMVFGDRVMRERLPADVYETLQSTIREGTPLSRGVAATVANAMRDWAIEKGATHYTHWFQPMTGITAEKHDSFVAPGEGGGAIMEFTGRELMRGEPDASSFPSGGLRATFEARGYTTWDATSYAFIKERTLCIPTAFCSYDGLALDKKTPLLRSMDALGKQALRLLHAIGRTDIRHVTATVGAEQEYFLIDKAMHAQRRDLKFCGRTLIGAPPPKGQEMDDHYFGVIRPRVKAFMAELDQELWMMGVPAKTEHNESAPAQHELAPVFTTVNIATDHNQLTMEAMKRVADRHDLYCLLHEKPFAGVNGSGKHNNWSLCTQDGENLLKPGDKPEENIPFLLLLTAVIMAVDTYQDLLRLSVATAGNDHRLGGNEAPPAVVSVFLGTDITALLEAIVADVPYAELRRGHLATGVSTLPHVRADNTDRNRTSPFAFTGNKFEFRMPGAPLSVAGPNIVLNTIAAEAFGRFAEALEGENDIREAARSLIRKTIREHGRILFNGNNYAQEWVDESARRGLLNLPTAADALPRFALAENIALFERHGVFSAAEVHSRCEIMLENYCHTVHIEALTLEELVARDILPAVSDFVGDISRSVLDRRALSPALVCARDHKLAEHLSQLIDDVETARERLSAATAKAAAMKHDDVRVRACHYRDEVLVAMGAVRTMVDQMEGLVGRTHWPMPTYGDLLYSV